MKSYGQYCALAKALDVIGDRWNLLIVRELLLRGPSRYTDLQHGLPGIATNLLSSRLRDLEAGGVIAREAAPPPVATTLFTLTERGQELTPVLTALGRWGSHYIVQSMEVALEADGGDGDGDGEGDGEGDASDALAAVDATDGSVDIFRSHWLAFPVSLFFGEQDPSSPPVTVEVRTGDRPVVIERRDGKVTLRTELAPAKNSERAELVLEGPPPLVLSALAGRVPLADVVARGLRVEGDTSALERLRDHAVATEAATA